MLPNVGAWFIDRRIVPVGGLSADPATFLEIADFGGVAAFAPRLATAFSIALFASIGLPTLCNFVGEFLLLQGAAIADFRWAIWAALGVILSAAYMLWMYQRTFLGQTQSGDPTFSRYAVARIGCPLCP